jgi:Glycosyltransferase (GlcNAc)
LLSRDVDTWGQEGTGVDAIDPDGECFHTDNKNNNNNNNNNNNQEFICPHYNYQDYDSKNDIIHYQVASFRDKLCPRTLYNLFHKAANPKRIYVRILQQIEHGSDKIDDADCWHMFCQTYGMENCEIYKDQVLVLTMNALLAKGPTDPRSKLSALLEYDYYQPTDMSPHPPALHPVYPHDYCLQTDSHMDFSQNFDIELIEMFHRTKNDYAVLSTYVAPMEQTDTFPTEVPHLCMVMYTHTWRNWGTKFCQSLQRPKLTNTAWGAGLSFSKCHAELNVPYDPYLPNVFDGEEISRGYRFFTHGYDIYTPDQVLVTHDYHGHQGNPNVHTWGQQLPEGSPLRSTGDDSDLSFFMKPIFDMEPRVQPKGLDRINRLLGFLESDTPLHDQDSPPQQETLSSTKYGHGNRRTLQQAITFSGFDPKQKKMVQNKCGNLKWVPYPNVEDFGLEFNLQRPILILEEYQLQQNPNIRQLIIISTTTIANAVYGSNRMLRFIVVILVWLLVIALLQQKRILRIFGKTNNKNE